MKTTKSPLGLTSLSSTLLPLVLLVAALTTTISMLSSYANASPLGPSNAQRRSLARHEARHLLTLVAVPTNAKRLTTWSLADGAALLSPSSSSSDPDHVNETRYFLVPGGASARTWFTAHHPRGGRVNASGSASGPGSDDVLFTAYSFRSGTSFLSLSLEYSTMVTPQGELGLRVDADATWTPRKSPTAIIASRATRVVVTTHYGLESARDLVSSTTTSNATIVSELLAHVNALPAAIPGLFHCPLDTGRSMTLRFFERGASRPYDVVRAEATGCGAVTILHDGANASLLATTSVSGGGTLTAYVAQVLDITGWTSPPAA